MVVCLPKFLQPNGFYKECVLGKHNQAYFGSRKAWHA